MMKQSTIVMALIVLVIGGWHCPSCPVSPPANRSDGGIGWVGTVREVLRVAREAIPEVRLVLDSGLIPLSPSARTETDQILDVLQNDLLPALARQIDSASTDLSTRCRVRSISADVVQIILRFADVLSNSGFDIAPAVRWVVSGLGAVVDEIGSDCVMTLADGGTVSRAMGASITARLALRRSPLSSFPSLSDAQRSRSDASAH